MEYKLKLKRKLLKIKIANPKFNKDTSVGENTSMKGIMREKKMFSDRAKVESNYDTSRSKLKESLKSFKSFRNRFGEKKSKGFRMDVKDKFNKYKESLRKLNFR